MFLIFRFGILDLFTALFFLSERRFFGHIIFHKSHTISFLILYNILCEKTLEQFYFGEFI